MKIFVSMLRGINLAGQNRIKMDALRVIYESLGLRNTQTYVQSGNVIFKAEIRDPAELAKRIESGLKRRFGFHADVIIRTAAELRDGVARNPFSGRPAIEPGELLVTFLAAHPGPEARAQVLSIKADPEEVQFEGREVYIYFPDGAGRSKFPWSRIDKIVEQPGTARNWNTVKKLLAMVEEMEDWCARDSTAHPSRLQC
jgi:uncharacterized protein (DUF1697 family)